MNDDPQTQTPELGPLVLGLVEAAEPLAENEEARRLASAAAALALIPNPTEAATYSAGLEHRVISRARELRAPRLRQRLRPNAARRIAFTLLLTGALAAAAVFAWLAFQPSDPIGGRALALSDDGQVGVLLPRYQERPFALVFWGLPAAEQDQAWQLWLVRESGEVTAGASFTPDDEGRAAIVLNPNTLESEDAPIGFAVSLDNPSERSATPPPREAIRYQFPLN